ncbi:MAG: lipoate--protein ligase family protein [Bacillota bacterium]
MKVRLISDGHLTGKVNMAVDEAIHRACQNGAAGPTLRFYQWQPACLSLGYFQDVEKEVRSESLREEGVDLVRRATGGKAVLHDDELTYSVIIAEKDLPGSVLETYHRLSEGLVEGLRTMGIPASLAALEHGVTSRDPRFRQAACFSAPSWYEIMSDDKKIIGSAQSRRNGFILQHGSIPFTFDAAKIVRCIRTGSPEHAARTEAMLRRKAAGVSDVLGRLVSREELQEHLVLGFRTVLGWDVQPGELSPGEKSDAKRLSFEKYGNDHWTMERGRQQEELY